VRDGGDHHPKPEVVAPAVREAPEAVRAAGETLRIDERPAPQHPGNGSLKIMRGPFVFLDIIGIAF